MSNDNAKEEYENGTVSLTLDDGTILECSVEAIYPVEDKFYIAIAPLTGEDAEKGAIYFYEYLEDENGEPQLGNIIDDEEYEIAIDAYDELLDAMEYEELLGEDEE